MDSSSQVILPHWVIASELPRLTRLETHKDVKGSKETIKSRETKQNGFLWGTCFFLVCLLALFVDTGNSTLSVTSTPGNSFTVVMIKVGKFIMFESSIMRIEDN